MGRVPYGINGRISENTADYHPEILQLHPFL